MKHTIKACGCCEGIETSTPRQTVNRPGLTALSYRIGTHATFLGTMQARLSSSDYPRLAGLTTREAGDPALALMDAWAAVADVLTFYNERIINEGYLRTATERRSILELARLVGYKLRPGVAAGVYLAYTMDDNSKDEIIIPKGSRSQSVPGPGESSQSFETVEDLKARAQWNNLKPRMTQPQTERSIRTGDGTNARIYLKGINTYLKPNDPLLIDFTGDDYPVFERVEEVKPDFAANRTLVILQSQAKQSTGMEWSRSFATGRIEKNDLGLIEKLTQAPSVQPANSLRLERNLRAQFIGISTENDIWNRTAHDERGLRATLTSGEASNAALRAFSPVLRDTLATAGANAQVTRENPIKVYGLRVKTAPFGHNAPPRPERLNNVTKIIEYGEWQIHNPLNTPAPIAKFTQDRSAGDAPLTVRFSDRSTGTISAYSWDFGDGGASTAQNPSHTFKSGGTYTVSLVVTGPQGSSRAQTTIAVSSGGPVIEMANIVIEPNQEIGKTAFLPDFHQERTLFIEGEHELSADSWVVIEKASAPQPIIVKVSPEAIVHRSLAAYGISGKTTQINLPEISPWIADPAQEPFSTVRSTKIYIQSEELELAEEPIEENVCGGTGQLIELDGVYEGLEAGRWVIVSGEREVGGTAGVRFSELAMLASVSQDTRNINAEEIEGNKLHTFIKFAEELKYCFKRHTVTIYGNVVKASHGETRREVLGSGDQTKPLQSFTLKQPPLTYVASSNPSGADSTLKVYVNDIQWHETDDLTGLARTERKFITKTDDGGRTTVIFGNGREGASPSTGIENIRAMYRNGIGKQGNVNAGQISLLTSRPLGVKEVTNPLRASGGADRENRDQARKNTPLALKALDRLVSVQDYEDFARIYAGIGKARATELSDGQRQIVHVTVAGADDMPIDKNSDLYRNLRRALLDNGDPYQAIQLEVRELMLIVIEARIHILPDYLWEPVVTQVRTALLEAFSFERRELGQDVLLSEVMSAIQAVPGVAYVDVNFFRGIPEKILDERHPGQRRLLTPGEIAELLSQPLTDNNDEVIEEPLSRISVNLAGREDGTVRPAQLAFLSPEVPATLILNQIL
jgi:predicted phage baseplate assembly protein